MHRVPPEHATPHPPQLRRSDPTSTQPPPQLVVPGMHADAHTPDEHTCAPHETPHLPQLVGLDRGSTQLPAHSTVPAGHTHEPKLHV